MNHKTYYQILDNRLRDDRNEEQAENMDVRVVYTSERLVKAGRDLMRARKKANNEHSTPKSRALAVTP